MLTRRWESTGELNRPREDMDRPFGVNRNSTSRTTTTGYPLLNVWEDDDQLYIEAELPGFEINQLEIYVNGGRQLSLYGERKIAQLEGGVWHRQERSHGSFSRQIDLPLAVDSDKVVAEFKYGVLTITLPKSEEAKPRRIDVKAS